MSTATDEQRAVFCEIPCPSCNEPIYKNQPHKRNDGIWYHNNCYYLLSVPVLSTGSVPSVAPSGGLGVLESILKDFMDKNTLRPESVEKMVSDAISRVVPKTVNVEVKRDGANPITLKSTHFMFPTVLEFLSLGIKNLYLHGAPGAGKSTAVMQVAEALGLRYGYIALNPQTPESKLFGFKHAGGQFVTTEFYDFYINGGVYFIDELDNGDASLQTTLNNFLENGFGSFPCGTVKRHQDFYMVTAGNTNGNGGNYQFPNRRAFDPAFKDRFICLEWEYDLDLEKAIMVSINPNAISWYEFVLKIREFVRREDIGLVVSPRATYNGAILLRSPKLKEKDIAEMVLWKGLDKDTVKRILTAIPLPKIDRNKP